MCFPGIAGFLLETSVGCLGIGKRPMARLATEGYHVDLVVKKMKDKRIEDRMQNLRNELGYYSTTDGLNRKDRLPHAHAAAREGQIMGRFVHPIMDPLHCICPGRRDPPVPLPTRLNAMVCGPGGSGTHSKETSFGVTRETVLIILRHRLCFQCPRDTRCTGFHTR